VRAGRVVGVDILFWVELWRGLIAQVCAKMCRWRLIVWRHAVWANGSTVRAELNSDTRCGETGMGSERFHGKIGRKDGGENPRCRNAHVIDPDASVKRLGLTVNHF
jgi:hypothetical protein